MYQVIQIELVFSNQRIHLRKISFRDLSFWVPSLLSFPSLVHSSMHESSIRPPCCIYPWLVGTLSSIISSWVSIHQSRILQILMMSSAPPNMHRTHIWSGSSRCKTSHKHACTFGLAKIIWPPNDLHHWYCCILRHASAKPTSNLSKFLSSARFC